MAKEKSILIEEILSLITQRLFDRSMTELPLSLSSSHITLAIEQGLGGLLYQLLSNVPSLPSHLIEPLHSVWINQIGGHLLRGRLLQQHWPDPLHPPLIIKGIDFEEHLYSPLGFNLGTRTSSDWDLLIPDPIYSQVTQEWTQKFGQALEPQSVRLSTEAPHELGFYIEGFLFELHQDPAPTYFTTVNGNDLWNNRVESESSWGQPISKPSEMDRLIIWLINFAKSGGLTRLLDWVDFCLILRSLSTEECQQVIFNPHLNYSLRRHALHLVASQAICVIRHTPLFYLIDCPNNQQRIDVYNQIDSTALIKSLNRYTSPATVAMHQIKYCHPQLRAEYIRRALIKWKYSTTVTPSA